MPFKHDEESTILCKPHKQVKCQKVKYELCEKDNRKVPVILVRKLYVPNFGKEKIVIKDNDGKCAKLCTDVIGWRLCSTDKHIINGLLTEKIFGPHFDKKCEKSEDRFESEESTEVDVKIKHKAKKNKKKFDHDD